MKIAALVCAAVIAGCAMAHERDGGPVPTIDAHVPHDVAVAPWDAGPSPVDAGPIRGCTEFWARLPSCPASPESAIGGYCADEGATCGVHCCEPGPPIACRGHEWRPVSIMDDCSGIRCGAPHPCGTGACATGRVCVQPGGEWGRASEVCVIPPSPIDSCAAAPPESVGDDPTACSACNCRTTPNGDVLIAIDCFCC